MSPIGDHPENRASTAAREPQGDRKECQRHEPEKQRELFQQLRQILCGLELVRLQDLYLPGVFGQPPREVAEDRDLISELDHEWLEIQRDRSLIGADRGEIVVEQPDELLVSANDRARPQGLKPRPREQPLGRPVCELAHRPGKGTSKRLLIRRQTRLELRLDVDVREELLDERRGDLVPNLVVGDQLVRALRDGRRVERLVANVARNHGGDGEDEPEQDQHAGQRHPPTRRGSRLSHLASILAAARGGASSGAAAIFVVTSAG